MVRKDGVTGKIIFAISAFLLVLIAPVSSAQAYSAQGQGDADHPYLITSCAQLQEINHDPTANYKLLRNIDCSSYGTFTSIGRSQDFTGVFNGNNYQIIGLSTTKGGLFDTANGAIIENVQLSGTITSANHLMSGTVGSVVNRALSTTITNVHSDATISGDMTIVGGIAGYFADATLSQSSYTGTITAGDAEAGGLVGNLSDVTIQDSYAKATISSNTSAGGLVGSAFNDYTLTRDYSASTLSAAPYNEGGLIAYTATDGSSVISDSFSATTIDDSAEDTGGIIGNADQISNVTDTFFDTNLTNGVTDCAGISNNSVSCGSISDSTYFKDNSSNPPFDTWDFSDSGPWRTVSGDYPELRTKDIFNATNEGDFNDDGIDDSFQGSVASVTLGGDYQTAFVVDPAGGCIVDNPMFWNISTDWAPADAPGYTQQSPTYWGADFYCTTPGTVIPVTLIFDKIYDTSHSVLRYFDLNTQTYTTIPATFSTVVLDGTRHTQATYNLTEGGPLDDDGVANGFIRDPVALVSTDTGSTNGNSNGNLPGAPNTGLKPQQGMWQYDSLLVVGIVLTFSSAVIALRAKLLK